MLLFFYVKIDVNDVHPQQKLYSHLILELKELNDHRNGNNQLEMKNVILSTASFAIHSR